jgi:hypothetical protein
MTDVFRSLCAELYQCLEYIDRTHDVPIPVPLLDRARTELTRHKQVSPAPADIAAAIESEQLNPWKAELIDALVCSHILQEEHYSNPRKALNDLIALDVQVATDPRTGPNALQKPKSFAKEPPTADDVDEDCLVWGLDAHLTWKRTHWRLIGRHGYSHWLPLWALPLPTTDENS